MPKVIFNGRVIAESDDTVMVEGNHYFPPDALRAEYFRATDSKTTCPWKGEARYYDVVVDGRTASDAAWYYPDPKRQARHIEDHVAFYRTKVDEIVA